MTNGHVKTAAEIHRRFWIKCWLVPNTFFNVYLEKLTTTDSVVMKIRMQAVWGRHIYEYWICGARASLVTLICLWRQPRLPVRALDIHFVISLKEIYDNPLPPVRLTASVRARPFICAAPVFVVVNVNFLSKRKKKKNRELSEKWIPTKWDEKHAMMAQKRSTSDGIGTSETGKKRDQNCA